MCVSVCLYKTVPGSDGRDVLDRRSLILLRCPRIVTVEVLGEPTVGRGTWREQTSVSSLR